MSIFGSIWITANDTGNKTYFSDWQKNGKAKTKPDTKYNAPVYPRTKEMR